ncbi:hypothetical protein SASPL_123838 [Salvia splendens]|uniref:BPM/SPOP BACK domain-containing protein n=1 Tax=Salvia splendens TaxID=180675 RepID=A0A8X8XME8_SALSN|nr:hypothetical protein SASPL_123838 [Salvia splendens]
MVIFILLSWILIEFGSRHKLSASRNGKQFLSCALGLAALLHFIYSNELPDFTEIVDSLPTSCTTMMQHLLADADRFGLDRLKLLCEEDLSTDTVATTLSLAEQHHCAQLKSICLKLGREVAGVWDKYFKNSISRQGIIEEMSKYTSCPSLLLELLETVALADEKPNLVSGKKRSSSSRWRSRIRES